MTKFAPWNIKVVGKYNYRQNNIQPCLVACLETFYSAAFSVSRTYHIILNDCRDILQNTYYSCSSNTVVIKKEGDEER